MPVTRCVICNTNSGTFIPTENGNWTCRNCLTEEEKKEQLEDSDLGP